MGDVGLEPVEGLRQAPAGIDPAEGAQAPGRGARVPALRPGGVGLERRLGPLQEDVVVPGTLGRALKRQDPRHHVRVHRRPVVGLERAHRPAGDEHELVDAEMLRDEAMLGADVVVGGDVGEARPVPRRGGVARRGREPVAEHVRDDDEVLVRVEGLAGADQPLVLRVLAGVPRRVDDGVVLGRAQGPEGLEDELGRAQRLAALEHEVAEFEDLVFGHAVPPRPTGSGRRPPHRCRRAAPRGRWRRSPSRSPGRRRRGRSSAPARTRRWTARARRGSSSGSGPSPG